MKKQQIKIELSLLTLLVSTSFSKKEKRNIFLRKKLYEKLSEHIDDFESFSYLVRKNKNRLPTIKEIIGKVFLLEAGTILVDYYAFIILILYPYEISFSQKMHLLELMSLQRGQVLYEHICSLDVNYFELSHFAESRTYVLDSSVRAAFLHHKEKYNEFF